MAWSWDTTKLTFDQTCWTFDGSNACIDRGGGGYPAAHTGPRKSPYQFLDRLPIRAVKEVAKKVEQYKKESPELDQAAIDSIVGAMVDTWPKLEMKEAMEHHGLDEDLAILAYRETLSQLIIDDDLAIILILASA